MNEWMNECMSERVHWCQFLYVSSTTLLLYEWALGICEYWCLCDGHTNWLTNQWTDMTSYRDARTHPKRQEETSALERERDKREMNNIIRENLGRKKNKTNKSKSKTRNWAKIFGRFRVLRAPNLPTDWRAHIESMSNCLKKTNSHTEVNKNGTSDTISMGMGGTHAYRQKDR